MMLSHVLKSKRIPGGNWGDGVGEVKGTCVEASFSTQSRPSSGLTYLLVQGWGRAGTLIPSVMSTPVGQGSPVPARDRR